MKKKIELAGAEACVGCAVCADICPKGYISMVSDSEGFLRPSVAQDSCIACGKCMSACPILHNTQKNDIKNLYAAWMNDSHKILDSTSGGVFQSLAQAVLEQGGEVYGAAFNDEFDLVHTRCRSIDDLPALLGSKYLQSKTQGIYKAVDQSVAAGNPVLFCGTPCQCDALNRYYLARNKAVPDQLIVCEIMCHGTPSPGVFKDYVAYLEKKKKNKIVKYNFRYKQLQGWSVLSQCITYTGGRKVAHKANYDAWHTWFGHHLSVRKSCFACKYRDVQRVADITIGDFWSIKKVMPEENTQNGISAVFVNTEKGLKCWECCLASLKTREISTGRVEELFNVPIRKASVKMPAERAEFFACYNRGGIKAAIKRFPPQTLFTAIITKLKWMIKK